MLSSPPVRTATRNYFEKKLDPFRIAMYMIAVGRTAQPSQLA